ncbi:MAG: transporter substrate-binding domain-containing protein [Saprospiraceae bacterium]|nr:transporter substrate-binding domain-containing protein [Saprospiraceae bacterium]
MEFKTIWKFSALRGLTCGIFVCFSAMGWANDTLVVGYMPSVPFVIVDGDEPSGISEWIWDQLHERMQQPMIRRECTFSELLSGLENGQIHFTINPLTMNSQRSKLMEFTYPLYAGYTAIAVPQMGEWKSFLASVRSFFSLNFFRGLLILLTIILFFGCLTWFFERRDNPLVFRPGLRGLWDGIWWSVVTMTTVGYGDKTPRTRGGKVVALIWMFSGLLFISGFTASIASSFTVNRLTDHRSTVEGFKTQRVGTVRHSATADFLQRSFFRKVALFADLDECFEALQKGDVKAVFYDEPILQYHLTRGTYPEAEILPLRCNLQYQGLAVASDHEGLRERLSQYVLEFSESFEWRELLEEYGLSSE